jgi:alkaline phosphatase
MRSLAKHPVFSMFQSLLIFRPTVVILALTLIPQIARPAMAEERARNVIIMIADGAGFNSWRATSMYRGRLGRETYDGPGWIKLASSTYPLTRSIWPTFTAEQDRALVYQPARAWDVALPASAHPSALVTAGYRFLGSTYTDSAAAATALATGVKTYNNAINWSNLNRPLTGKTIAEIAKAQGKAVGVITTVFWCDATPAGLGGAHNVSRQNHQEIANQMLSAPYLDLIMGAGHPGFDDDGRPLGEAASDTVSPPTDRPARRRYVDVGGQETWRLLTSGKHPAGWTLVESRAAICTLGQGAEGAATPRKVLATLQAATTLQQKRTGRASPGSNRGEAPVAVDKTGTGSEPLPVKPARADRGEVPVPVLSGAGSSEPSPFSCPLNRNVPSLAEMSWAAIHCLARGGNGFYLQIEGGAVDWANHANQKSRMIEEQIDFLQAVEAVAVWVDAHSNWNETLLVLTADHETGMLWGKNSDRAPFDPIVDRGPGRVPDMRFNSKQHTNSLVPLFARGAGSRQLLARVRGTDAMAARQYGISGQYVDNTDIFAVMRLAVAGPANRRLPAASASKP